MGFACNDFTLTTGMGNWHLGLNIGSGALQIDLKD